MNPDALFSLASSVALIAWLTLIITFFFPGRVRSTGLLVCRFIVPALLSLLYLVIIAARWAGHQGGFGSLNDVQKLFADPWLLLAGWVHYLAFDLSLGGWQVSDAARSEIPHLWVIPCLLLTFMFGPIGLLAYLLLRTLRGRAGLVPTA